MDANNVKDFPTFPPIIVLDGEVVRPGEVFKPPTLLPGRSLAAIIIKEGHYTNQSK